MKTVLKICNVITYVASIAGMVFVVAMVLLTFCDVVMRYIFKSPIIGATELVQMMFICLVLGWGNSASGRDNLRIDIVLDALPKKVAAIVDIIVTVVMIGIAILIAYALMVSAGFSKQFNEYYSLLKFPKYPFIIIMCVGYLIGVVGLISKIIRHILELLRLDEPQQQKGDVAE